MTREQDNEPKCLNCGHRFTASEAAAMVATRHQEDLCVIDCSACGSHNIVRAEPQGGFNRQPQLVVLRLSGGNVDTDDVFDETVDPDTDVHPVTRGESQ